MNPLPQIPQIPQDSSLTHSLVITKDRNTFHNALLVAGLPGIGLVSKMAVDHLIRLTKAKKIASLYSHHLPNQVLVLKSGKLKAFSLRFYHKKIGSRDVLFLRGEVQPLTIEGQYEVCSKILEYVRDLVVTEVIAMAGYAVNKKTSTPVLYASATSKRLFNKLGSFGTINTPTIVPVVGMAGLVPALASIYGLQGACVLVETPGTMVDAIGAKALVALLAKYLNTSFNTKDLDKSANAAQKLLSRVEAHVLQNQRPGTALAPVPQETAGKDVLRYIH